MKLKLQQNGNQDQTSMFLNKYSEDINLPSVSNTYADIVVDYMKNRNLIINEHEDFDLDDAEDDEQAFLREVDLELDRSDSDSEVEPDEVKRDVDVLSMKDTS